LFHSKPGANPLSLNFTNYYIVIYSWIITSKYIVELFDFLNKKLVYYM
jgi:hypothetical protein